MAFTEKYVSSAASGSGNGNAEGTAYSFSQMVTLINGATAGGWRFNVKADGNYNRTGGDDMTSGTGGTVANPIVIRGYKTAIGDGYLGRSSAGALITTNLPFIDYNPGGNGWFKPPQYVIVESINLRGYSQGDFVTLTNNSAMVNCNVNANGTDAALAAIRFGGDTNTIFECDFAITTSGSTYYVATSSTGGVRIDSCRFISSAAGAGGMRVDIRTSMYGCLFKGNGGPVGIHVNQNNKDTLIRNCTITGWVDGIKFDAAMNNLSFVAGNMVTDNSGYAVNLVNTTSWMGIIGPNRTRDNTLGDTNNAGQNWANVGRIISNVTTDTGGPETDYVNAAGNDYNLIPTSPGKGGNLPKVSDLGAYGLPDPTVVVTGGAAFHPLLPQIVRPAPSE